MDTSCIDGKTLDMDGRERGVTVELMLLTSIDDLVVE